MKSNKKVIVIVAVIALVAILGVCLVACNADSYTKKLEKKGYTVTNLLDEDSTAGVDEAKVEWAIMAIKGTGLLSGDMVTVVKFKTTDDAKEAEKSAKDSKQTVSRSGKIVIAGTEQGVKDAK